MEGAEEAGYVFFVAGSGGGEERHQGVEAVISVIGNVNQAGVEDAASGVVRGDFAAGETGDGDTGFADESGLGAGEHAVAGLVEGAVRPVVVGAGDGWVVGPGDGVDGVAAGAGAEHFDGLGAAGFVEGRGFGVLGAGGHFDFEAIGLVVEGAPFDGGRFEGAGRRGCIRCGWGVNGAVAGILITVVEGKISGQP